MTKAVVCAAEEAPFKELVRLMHENRVSSLPVVDPVGRAIGVVSEGDLLLKEDLAFREEVRFFEGREFRSQRRKAAGLKARDLMTTPAITTGAEATVTEAAHLMHVNRVRRLPVVDEQDRVLGIVSRVDLLGEYLREDADLAAEVSALLAEDFALGLDAVRVEARDGVVYVEGKVVERSLIDEIGHRVRRVDGVVGVDAHMMWEVDDTSMQLGPVPWVGF